MLNARLIVPLAQQPISESVGYCSRRIALTLIDSAQ